jgi:hypothetical protein
VPRDQDALVWVPADHLRESGASTGKVLIPGFRPWRVRPVGVGLRRAAESGDDFVPRQSVGLAVIGSAEPWLDLDRQPQGCGQDVPPAIPATLQCASPCRVSTRLVIAAIGTLVCRSATG